MMSDVLLFLECLGSVAAGVGLFAGAATAIVVFFHRQNWA
jgi:hypothetical protein